MRCIKIITSALLGLCTNDQTLRGSRSIHIYEKFPFEKTIEAAEAVPLLQPLLYKHDPKRWPCRNTQSENLLFCSNIARQPSLLHYARLSYSTLSFQIIFVVEYCHRTERHEAIAPVPLSCAARFLSLKMLVMWNLVEELIWEEADGVVDEAFK